jgi:hypothetical protein
MTEIRKGPTPPTAQQTTVDEQVATELYRKQREREELQARRGKETKRKGRVDAPIVDETESILDVDAGISAEAPATAVHVPVGADEEDALSLDHKKQRSAARKIAAAFRRVLADIATDASADPAEALPDVWKVQAQAARLMPIDAARNEVRELLRLVTGGETGRLPADPDRAFAPLVAALAEEAVEWPPDVPPGHTPRGREWNALVQWVVTGGASAMTAEAEKELTDELDLLDL